MKALEQAQATDTLARVRLAQGRRAEAVRLLRDLVKTAPQPRHLYLLAEATGETADAEAFEKAALACSSSPDNANRELALYYAERAAQPARALEIARRESRRRHDPYTLDALAVALFAAGATREARSAMDRVVAAGTKDPLILQHAARIGTARAPSLRMNGLQRWNGASRSIRGTRPFATSWRAYISRKRVTRPMMDTGSVPRRSSAIC
jgi:tetratricopeptide (TPR) repeat protein